MEDIEVIFRELQKESITDFELKDKMEKEIMYVRHMKNLYRRFSIATFFVGLAAVLISGFSKGTYDVMSLAALFLSIETIILSGISLSGTNICSESCWWNRDFPRIYRNIFSIEEFGGENIDKKIFLDNSIPTSYKKNLHNFSMIFFPMLVFLYIMLMFILGASNYYILITTILIIMAYVFIPWMGEHKLHPIQIAFTEDGIILKRANGKIKHLGWNKITGLRLGKNAAIFVNSFFEPVIYIFGETEENALYYFKKYGVKKNPKLEKVIFNLEMKQIHERGRKRYD